MKQKILYIFVLITALLGGNGEAWAWGDDISYLIEDDATLVIMDDLSSSKTKDFTWNSGYAQTLSFEVIGYDSWIFPFTGGCEVNVYNKDNKSILETSYDISTSWTTKKLENIPDDAVKISIKGTGTLKKEIRNVKVTRATTLSMSSTNTLPLNMGEVKIGKTVSTTVNVDFNNTTYNQELTGTCTNTAFTIESRSMGEYGTNVPVTIKFSPATAVTHKGTVTLSMNGKTTSFEVTGTAQDKGRPAFTWNLSNVATNREYTGFFSTTNEDTDISFSSSDPSIANVVDGALVTYDKEGSTTITVTQAGNDDWHAKTEPYTITVKRPQNHLPLEITESNWSVLARNLNGGSFAWDGGIQHHSLAYGNREFEIAFTGIPDKLSFNYRVTDSNIDSEVKWTVYEGADGSNFTEAWTTGTEKGSIEIQLKPTTRYVRIKCYCIYYENVSNIKITELRYMNTETTDINFGEHYQGATVEPQTFVLNHCNVGAGAAVVSSNSNFIVNPINTTQTGGDIMGTETIAVTYLNNTEGEHAGTITITDPSGKNSTPVVINVSGKTKADRLILNPKESPNYEARTYQQVILNRTLPQGHFTATFPFEYDINAVEGAYIAQLAFVTYNSQDGYTLYLQKKEDGIMLANQPYVVYLPSDITNPQWTDVTVKVPVAGDITLDNWTMQGNYIHGFPMAGNYGIAGGKFCLGTEGSTINAYTAYFTFLGTKNVRARVAVMDEGGNTTYIGEVSDLNGNAAEEVFGIDGMRLPEMRKGINIVRQKDGSVRKIVK